MFSILQGTDKEFIVSSSRAFQKDTVSWVDILVVADIKTFSNRMVFQPPDCPSILLRVCTNSSDVDTKHKGHKNGVQCSAVH